MLESIYETVLSRDLNRRKLHVERQKWISFDYDGLWFEDAFRIDLLVERHVIVEIKSVVVLNPVFYKQTLSYMKLANCDTGLLINFGASTFKDAVKRLVL